MLPDAEKAHPRLAALGRSTRSVADYYADVANDPVVAPGDPVSRRLLARAAGSMVQQVFGPGCGDLGERLRDRAAAAVAAPRTVVSLAEHHASITHPETTTVVAGEVLYALASGADTVLSFAGGTVPLDNELFPRGAMVGWHKVPFLPRKFRRLSPVACPRMDTSLFRDGLRAAYKDGHLDAETYDEVGAWWAGTEPEIEAAGAYWQQISVLNLRTFERMFPSWSLSYVMLPVELLTRDLLLACLDDAPDSWVLRHLFDARLRMTLLKALDGVRTFWDSDSGKGTFLFWAADDSGRLAPVGLDGGDLVTADGTVRVPIAPGPLREAMAAGTLIPASSCVFLLLAFQTGLRNFGGLLQYDYLAEARQRLTRATALDLTDAERRTIVDSPDSFYVNFEEKDALSGGLARIARPIGEADLHTVGTEPMGRSIGGCLSWVDSLYS
ncbi:hypothetical protein AB0L14_22980 [Streptomyces sp. NPDC052727]|uniref:hypothetical protein n=1 Tax=Streptomyces sp. NPDC052727 TaxID=3154854 RepID=UPI00342DAD1F